MGSLFFVTPTCFTQVSSKNFLMTERKVHYKKHKHSSHHKSRSYAFREKYYIENLKKK